MTTASLPLEDYQVRFSGSAALHGRAAEVLAGGAAHDLWDTHPFPVYFERAKGPYKWDHEAGRTRAHRAPARHQVRRPLPRLGILHPRRTGHRRSHRRLRTGVAPRARGPGKGDHARRALTRGTPSVARETPAQIPAPASSVPARSDGLLHHRRVGDGPALR